MTTRLWMFALGLGWLSSAFACEDARTQPVLEVEVPAPTRTRVALGKAFDLGNAHGCRVQSASPYLAERTRTKGTKRAPEDVLVLRVRAECERGIELLRDVRWVWVSPNGEAREPTEQTTTPKGPETELQRVFEWPPDEPPKPTSAVLGELRLRHPAGDVDVVLEARTTPLAAESKGAQPSTCEKRGAQLSARARERFAQAKSQGPECNVLGWLQPVSCADAEREPDVLESALRYARRCGSPAIDSLLAYNATWAPEDFAVTLRRDRCAAGLDRCPRFTLVVHHNGLTVFHGKHWVTALGRSDGRTHLKLVGGLWRSIRDSDFLSRRGGSSDDPRCTARGSDEGNLLRVQGAGKSRMVVDREGCRGPFSSEELEALAAKVEAAAGSSAWIGARPSYADRKIRIWTVGLD